MLARQVLSKQRSPVRLIVTAVMPPGRYQAPSTLCQCQFMSLSAQPELHMVTKSHRAQVVSKAALHRVQPVQPVSCFLFASNFRMLHAPVWGCRGGTCYQPCPHSSSQQAAVFSLQVAATASRSCLVPERELLSACCQACSVGGPHACRQLEEAVRFCSVLQKELLHLPWPEEVLSWLACGEVHDAASGHTIWRGLRVRMGMAYGRPDYRKPLNTGGRRLLCWSTCPGCWCRPWYGGRRAAPASMTVVARHRIIFLSKQWVAVATQLGSCNQFCMAGLQGIPSMVCTTNLSCSTAQLQIAQ